MSDGRDRMMSFVEWKAWRKLQDGPVINLRDWYYTEYGRYCKNYKGGEADE